MGTRSRIGVMHGEVVKSVYCHWDGYLACNGRILLENYDSPKANALVALGDISSLGAELGEKHDFNARYDNTDPRSNWTVAYGRDRGEEGCGWNVAHSFDEFLEQVDNCCAEYYYIMKDGVWYAGCVYDTDGLERRGLVRLDEAMAVILEEEAA